MGRNGRLGSPVGIGLAVACGLVCLVSRLVREQPKGSSSTAAEGENERPPLGGAARAAEGEELIGTAGGSSGEVLHCGWARLREGSMREALGEKSYLLLRAFMRWCAGAEVEALAAELGVSRSGFYYLMHRVVEQWPAVTADGRRQNGRRPAALASGLTGRIVEIVVSEPGISPAAIRDRLTKQDGTQVSADAVARYLEQAGLVGYQGSVYRQAAAPAAKAGEKTFTRYAAHLLQVPALETLGYYEAVPLLDVTGEDARYSNLLRCDTVVFGLSAGKTRLYHTGELVDDEFGRVLGERRYPRSSTLHAYFDAIVARDAEEENAGKAAEERIVGRFLRQSQHLLGHRAAEGVGKAIYVDPHVIAVGTGKPVGKTKHGIKERMVKALIKVRIVSAQRRPLATIMGPSDWSLQQNLGAAVEMASWATGEAVELVAVDRGGLSQEVLEEFQKGETGLVVWSDDTTTMREALAAVPRSAFGDGEYRRVRREDGHKVQRLFTRLADVPGMVINLRGYRCRTIVVERVSDGHRCGIHVVGKRTEAMTPLEIVGFLRHKQWVEEDIQQGIAWGSDDFCGGKVISKLRRKQPDAAEIEKLKERGRTLKARLRDSLVEAHGLRQRYRARDLTKRQLDDLMKGVERRRQRVEKERLGVESLIAWGKTAKVPQGQWRWDIDTRKMSIMAQLQDFTRLARGSVMELLRRCMKQVVVQTSVGERGGDVTAKQRQEIEAAAEAALAGMPWHQIETRVFAHGGWVQRDDEQKVLTVSLKTPPVPLLEPALRMVCDELNARQASWRCRGGPYRLHYTSGCAAPP
jgi:hypothetical protein